MKYPNVFQDAKNISNVTEDQWLEFEAKLEEMSVSKNSEIMKPGDTDRTIYIVLEGVMRNYCIDSNGREYTKVFRGPLSLIGPYAEILQGFPSRYYISAVVDSKVARIDYDKYDEMVNKYPEWMKLAKVYAEANFVEKEAREFMLLQMDAAQKYEEFKKNFGHIVDQIPQYQVASYLGITPEAFNRMLRKSKNK